MIPLRDNAAPRRLTPVNIALIAVNVAVFLYELSLGPRVAAVVERFALVPAAVTRDVERRAWRSPPTRATDDDRHVDVHPRRHFAHRGQHALPLHLRRGGGVSDGRGTVPDFLSRCRNRRGARDGVDRA